MYANLGPGMEVALASPSSGPEVMYSHQYVAGRILQRNLYGYCDNNPINWMDPSGLKKLPAPPPPTTNPVPTPSPNPSLVGRLGGFCTRWIVGPITIIFCDPTPCTIRKSTPGPAGAGTKLGKSVLRMPDGRRRASVPRHSLQHRHQQSYQRMLRYGLHSGDDAV